MNIKTVRLELLRPGPPHNQLLSPLTSYIALCGDEPPETVHIPFEHYRLLQRIQALRPPSTAAEVQAALTELREDVVAMLAGIRCLATSLAEAHGDGVELIELELVLSASELSLIPFEVAFYPGSPTRELAHREVIVMRRSRRVPRARLRWEHRPRVLVVAASPPGFEPVPIEAHVAGIREALAPWLSYLDGHDDDALILSELRKFCVVLPNASELAIQEAIHDAAEQRHGFTHIHILAHGGELSADDPDSAARGALREPRFGLVLHHAGNARRRDTLGGRRLFAALAGSDGQCGRKLPQVVTLASCDSGNLGGVVVPGASVAHDIHDGGVPLVVASQFPLSYQGSVVFVKRLYERLLEGDDPRCALRETRRAVFASATRDVGSVDWGAVVQYGALPHDLPSHVYQARFRALRHRIDSAVSSVDQLVIPPGRGDLVQAWRGMSAGINLLEQHKGDPAVDRHIARVHLRWAFILRARARSPSSADVQAFARLAVPTVPEPQDALRIAEVRSLRAFRDGLYRHYRTTCHPASLVEVLHGNFFLGEPVTLTHALTAATQCIESLQATPRSRDSVHKLEKALLYLWILVPSVEQPATSELESMIVRGRGPDWFMAMLDNQFADAPPTDFEYFTLWRNCARIADIPDDRPAASAVETRNRARRVADFLVSRGVPMKFSAVVDWFEQPDGGVRTVAT
jgi:hypothetical protein